MFKKFKPEHWLHSLDKDEIFNIEIIGYGDLNPEKKPSDPWFKMPCNFTSSFLYHQIPPSDSFTRMMYVSLLCSYPSATLQLACSLRFLSKLVAITRVSYTCALLKLVEIKAITISKRDREREERERREGTSSSSSFRTAPAVPEDRCPSDTSTPITVSPPVEVELKIIRNMYGSKKYTTQFVQEKSKLIEDYCSGSLSLINDVLTASSKIRFMIDKNKKSKEYGFFATTLETLLSPEKDLDKYLLVDDTPFLLDVSKDNGTNHLVYNSEEEGMEALRKLEEMGYKPIKK